MNSLRIFVLDQDLVSAIEGKSEEWKLSMDDTVVKILKAGLSGPGSSKSAAKQTIKPTPKPAAKPVEKPTPKITAKPAEKPAVKDPENDKDSKK